MECSMLTLVAGHEDLGVHLEVLREEVADGVVFLLDDEVGSVGHASNGLLLELLLAFSKDEELETTREMLALRTQTSMYS